MAAVSPTAGVAIALQPQVRSSGFFARLFRDKPLGAAGGVLLLFFVIVGLTAQWISPYGFNEIAPIERLKPPSWAHWFGTDNLGRDVLSRCIYGAQLSVIIGCSAALLATVISAVIGIVSGYAGGRFDLIVQRFVDAWQSFPDLIILIVVVSVIGPGMPQIIGTLALLLGIAGSRIVRSAVIAARARVHAAQSIGASVPRILWRHILPNVMPPIIVLFTTRVGNRDLGQSGLAFLGLGVRRLHDLGRDVVGQQPHLHVQGPVAGVGTGPVPDRGGVRHQCVRRRAAQSARSACAARGDSFPPSRRRSNDPLEDSAPGRCGLSVPPWPRSLRCRLPPSSLPSSAGGQTAIRRRSQHRQRLRHRLADVGRHRRLGWKNNRTPGWPTSSCSPPT
jgi:peptide/nickel transport system permease protein